VEFKFKRFTQNSKTYTLNNSGEKIDTQYGKIHFDEINNNALSFRLPTSISKNIQINALYKDGRLLESTGGGSFTYMSDEKKRFIKEYLEIIKKAKSKINQGKIHTEKQLEKYLTKQRPPFKEDIPYMVKNYNFKGPVNTVEVVVRDTITTTKVHNVTYNLDEQHYLVASDFKTSKKGIIDQSGKWIAKPKFTDNFRKLNKYFFRDQLSYGYGDPRNYDNYYFLDEKNKTLSKVDYQLDEIELYENRFIQIEPETNGAIGVLDVKTKQIIIPMEHRWLKYHKPGIWVGDNVTSEDAGAYNQEGKVILPFEFDVVDYINGFFYTVSGYKDRDKRDIKNIYNTYGKNITQSKYDEIEGSFNDGLQLVAKYTFKEGTINRITATDYFFIDKNGKEVLSFPHKEYHEVAPFKNGLSKVEKSNNDNLKYDGDYGFINTKGKVVIPFIYKTAMPFYGKYAYVEYKKGSDYWVGFIDKNNKRILEINDTYQAGWYDKKTKKHYMKTWKGEVYDYDGNKIEKN